MSDSDRPLALVVGAGGIGCPAAWALARSGRWRLRLIDHDRVELSNLPRQVLYGPDDVGRPKAKVAAERLRTLASVEGIHARLDSDTIDNVLDGVSVMIDATDGAQTKDWLNQLAVRTRTPFVHAAGLRSEARLMAIAAGGAPCLSCVFGRLEDDGGRCSDLGVWNGVVGAIGCLAAHRADALRRHASQPAYEVLDMAAGRALSLGARPRAACPVCGASSGDMAVEPFPEFVACDVPNGQASPSPTAPGPIAHRLDLSSERCPMNLLRARQALDALERDELIEFTLGQEGAATVPDGVRMLGHDVVEVRRRAEDEGVHVVVRVSAAPSASELPRLPSEIVQRFARQLVLEDVGSAGQQTLFRSTVRVVSQSSLLLDTALIYLAAAGVGRFQLAASYATSCSARHRTHLERVAVGVFDEADSGTREGFTLVVENRELEGVVPVPNETRDLPPSIAMARGALLADHIQRRLVDSSGAAPALIGVSNDGALQSV